MKVYFATTIILTFLWMYSLNVGAANVKNVVNSNGLVLCAFSSGVDTEIM